MKHKIKARAYHSAVSEYDQDTIVRLVRKDYIQHNPKVPTGRSAFIDLLPKLKEHQTKIMNIRMLQDDNYVCMHHLWDEALPFGAKQMAAFHIIRFDLEGLIAEHWNVMKELAPLNLSGRSMLSGETEISDLERTKSNKSIVKNLILCLCEANKARQIRVMQRFFLPGFYQHHPDVEDGIAGYKRARDLGALNIQYKKLHKVLGEGNFVLSVTEGAVGEIPMALYDLFRLENDLIAEHWNIYQEIPSQGLANNNTMFNF